MKNFSSLNKSLPIIIAMSLGCCVVLIPSINAAINYKNSIETYVNDVPGVVTTSPLNITAYGSNTLSNVSLYYKYNLHNYSMSSYGFELRDVFREGADTTVFDYPNTIKVVGDVGYAISYKDNSLVLINVSNPSMLTQLSYKVDSIYLKTVHDVAVSIDGKYAYTISYITNPWLCIWNVTNPTITPIRMNQIQLSSVGKGMYLNFDQARNFLFVTTTDYCYILNITNKASGQLDLVSRFNTSIPVTSWRWHTYILDDALYVFVGNQSSKISGDGVYVYNISDKVHPVLVNHFNHTAMIREFREYHWQGFHYLVGFIQYTKEASMYRWYKFHYLNDPVQYDTSTYWTAALGLWNVSSGNATHPDFVGQVSTLEEDGTFTSDAFDIYNGYAFGMRKNVNTSVYTGVTAYSLKDIHDIFKVDHIDGAGYPNFLNLCHEVEFNQNGIDDTVYVVSQTSDALTTLHFDPQVQNNNSWVFYGTDSEFPWCWNFNFPNGTGYYEFYSIGKWNGDTEQPPESADASCQYQPQQLVKALLFGSITNKNVDDETIEFDSVKTWKLTFSPLHFYKYPSSETITIDKNYYGLIGNKYIFTLCTIIYLK